MITNLHDLIIAVKNAIYGEEILVNENIYNWYTRTWHCILLDEIEIKNLKIINGENKND